MRSVFASAVLVLSLAFAPQANAALITYEFTGVGSGQIGGTSFTNALVVYTGTANTNNVISDEVIPGIFFHAVPLDSLTVNIAGVGPATVTDATEIIGIPIALTDEQDTDDELPPFPLVLLGRTDHPPDLDSLTGMAATGSDGLAGYNLKTSIGPLGGVGGVGFNTECAPGPDPCIGTSIGLLSFTTNLDSEGTFTATRAAPEPATMALIGAGLLALVRRARRGARR